MSSLPALTAISNGTTADATEVDSNFDTLATFVDAELVNRDGTIAMTGELSLSSSSPSGALVAASKGYVDSLAPATNIATFTRSSSFTATSGGSGSVTFQSESNDTDGWWSSGTTFTCPASGLYVVTIQSAAASAPAGQVSIAPATSGYIVGYSADAISIHSGQLSGLAAGYFVMNAGATFTAGWQNSTYSSTSGSITVTSVTLRIIKIATY